MDTRPQNEFLEEPPDEYHAHPALGSSMLRMFLESPRLFEAYCVTKSAEWPRPSDPLKLGLASHAFLLEPERFDDRVAVIPPEYLASNGAASTNKAKDFIDECYERGVIPLKEREWKKVHVIRAAVEANPFARELLANGTAASESSLYVTDPQTSLGCKIRPDLVSRFRGRTMIPDLKTAADHRPEPWGKSAFRFGYQVQAAFYQRMYERAFDDVPEFVFVVVRSSPPHTVRVYQLDTAAVDLGHYQVRRGLDDVAERYDSGDWSEPGEDLIGEVSFPRYAFEAV